MVNRIIPLLLFFCTINAQIALPTFQGVHKVHSSSSALYSFTSHTFTNSGATLREGPTHAQCHSEYSPSWTDTTDYFTMNNNNGIQIWTVPATGQYTIEAWGASSGVGNSNWGPGGFAGLGVKYTGTFTLEQGNKLSIVVGQQGAGASYGCMGGGGSFVALGADYTTATPLLVAGGGGGSGTYQTSKHANQDATYSNTGQSSSDGIAGGSGGNYGGYDTDLPHYMAQPGGGFYTRAPSTNAQYTGDPGYAFRQIPYGGEGRVNGSTSEGGFGGGGGGNIDSSGGGGYSGGAGHGSSSSNGAWNTGGSGGGGSYNSGTNKIQGGTNEDNGKVIITKL